LLSCGVPKLRVFFRYWLIVLVWMVLIFSASGDQMSFQRSSRILGPLIHWLLPQLSNESVHAAVVSIRKCAHFGEFAVLALLLWRALRKPARNETRPWEWRTAAIALLLVVAYAASDEIHQLFVPSRQGSILDVMIDSSGALLALIFLWAFGRWRHRW
jgi:VanZ family protein